MHTWCAQMHTWTFANDRLWIYYTYITIVVYMLTSTYISFYPVNNCYHKHSMNIWSHIYLTVMYHISKQVWIFGDFYITKYYDPYHAFVIYCCIKFYIVKRHDSLVFMHNQEKTRFTYKLNLFNIHLKVTSFRKFNIWLFVSHSPYTEVNSYFST